MTWYWFAIGSAVLLAVATLLEKKILFKEHAMEFSAVLAFFNALISLPLLLLADFSNISLQVLGAIYIASLLGTASFYLVAKVNRHMEVSESSPLLVSTEIEVKGKKKIGSKTITIKSDQKEILSKIFENIVF